MWFDDRQSGSKRKFEEEVNTKYIDKSAHQDHYNLHPRSQSAQNPSNEGRSARSSQLRSNETSMSAFKRIRLENGLQFSTLHEIFKLFDGNLQMRTSRIQFDKLLRRLYSKQSKWASKLWIGQQEVYEAAEVVLLKLIHVEEDADVLTRISASNRIYFEGTY